MSLCASALCLIANICNFESFAHSGVAQSSIHLRLTPTQFNTKTLVKPTDSMRYCEAGGREALEDMFSDRFCFGTFSLLSYRIW